MVIPKALQVRETMKGNHHFVDPDWGNPDDRPFYFVIKWQGDLVSALNPWSEGFLRFAAAGDIYAEGLTLRGEVPCEGALVVDYFRTRTIRYVLDFVVGEETYRYEGSKVDVDLTKPLLLIKSHTTCYGHVSRSDGTVLSRSVTHFEPHTLVPFLMSLRISR